MGHPTLFQESQIKDTKTVPQLTPEEVSWFNNVAESGYYVERLAGEAQELLTSLP